MSSIFNVGRRDPVEAYAQQVTEDMPDEQRRELEMKLLRPSPMIKYPMPTATAETKLTMYVKLYFDTEEELEEFCSMVRVSKMVERTTREGKKINAALKAACEKQ